MRTMLVAGVIGRGAARRPPCIQARSAGRHGRARRRGARPPRPARRGGGGPRRRPIPGAEVRVGRRARRAARARAGRGGPGRAQGRAAGRDRLRRAARRAGRGARARAPRREAEVRLAELNRDRRERLVREQIVAAHDLDQASRDLDIARARLETASAEVDALRGAAPQDAHRGAHRGHGDRARRWTPARRSRPATTRSRSPTSAGCASRREADEADAGALARGRAGRDHRRRLPGPLLEGPRSRRSRTSVTLRQLKPQDPGRPTDTRILAVKVAFAEPTPLKLGTTVELRIEPRRP